MRLLAIAPLGSGSGHPGNSAGNRFFPDERLFCRNSSVSPLLASGALPNLRTTACALLHLCHCGFALLVSQRLPLMIRSEMLIIKSATRQGSAPQTETRKPNGAHRVTRPTCLGIPSPFSCHPSSCQHPLKQDLPEDFLKDSPNSRVLTRESYGAPLGA